MFCLSKGFRIQRLFKSDANGEMRFPKTLKSRQAPPRVPIGELLPGSWGQLQVGRPADKEGTHSRPSRLTEAPQHFTFRDSARRFQ